MHARGLEKFGSLGSIKPYVLCVVVYLSIPKLRGVQQPVKVLESATTHANVQGFDIWKGSHVPTFIVKGFTKVVKMVITWGKKSIL